MPIRLNGSKNVITDGVNRTYGLFGSYTAQQSLTPYVYGVLGTLPSDSRFGEINRYLNISSFTRTATGRYNIVFINAFPHSNTCTIAQANRNNTTGTSLAFYDNSGLQQSGSVDIRVANLASTPAVLDPLELYIMSYGLVT